MRYLLDTCVLSELVKPSPNQAVINWMAAQQAPSLFISAITLSELQRGVAKLPASRRRSDLSKWLRQTEAGFEDRVLSFSQTTSPHWAQMVAKAEASGHTLSSLDSIIAAVALEHGLTIVTRNVKDFAHAPVVLLNPWLSAG